MTTRELLGYDTCNAVLRNSVKRHETVRPGDHETEVSGQLDICLDAATEIAWYEADKVVCSNECDLCGLVNLSCNEKCHLDLSVRSATIQHNRSV